MKSTVQTKGASQVDGVAMTLLERPRVALAARVIVRLICEMEIPSGGKLPSQASLRTLTRLHNEILNEGLKLLASCGMIHRKNKSGTTVENPEAVVPGLWRVGVPMNLGTGGFYDQMIVRLHIRAEEHGIVLTPFLRTVDSEMKTSDVSLRDFDGLHAAHAAGVLDGIMTQSILDAEDWEARMQEGFAMAHAGAWEEAPAGVVICQKALVESAVAYFAGHRCRHPGIVGGSVNAEGLISCPTAFVKAFENAGFRSASVCCTGWTKSPFGGQCAAEYLLALPSRERPDCLVVLNDHIGSGLTAALVSTSYRPRLVVQTNRQAPLAYAYPVAHCEVDVEALANRAMDNLAARLRNRSLPLTREWLLPEMHAEPRVISTAQQH